MGNHVFVVNVVSFVAVPLLLHFLGQHRRAKALKALGMKTRIELLAPERTGFLYRCAPITNVT
jgi:hypothetical protein